MKIRSGFVSNSSSSSFLIVNPKNLEKLIENNISFNKLDKEQIERVKKWLTQSTEYHMNKWKNDEESSIYDEYYEKSILLDYIKPEDDVYVTSFISDSCDEHYEVGHKIGIEYMDGGHGIPYSEEDLECLNPNEDDKYKRVYINE